MLLPRLHSGEVRTLEHWSAYMGDGDLNVLISRISEAIDSEEFELAKQLALETHHAFDAQRENVALAAEQSRFGGVLIDLGTIMHSSKLTSLGTEYAEKAIQLLPESDRRMQHYYFAGNGYAEQYKAKQRRAQWDGRLDATLLMAKERYRNALAVDVNYPNDRYLHCHLLINYANILDSNFRHFEALALYDKAIAIDPKHGEGLGNKAVTLKHLAPLVHGHAHAVLLESRALMHRALECDLYPEARVSFEATLLSLDKQLGEHDLSVIERTTRSSPLTEFGIFHEQFCKHHELFLTPVVHFREQGFELTGDPMYISRMMAPIDNVEKFDRYVALLNEIKQDYVVARYLLVRSQFHSAEIDEIDEGVVLYNPLDYSAHSTYIQFLKLAHKAAVDTLDKVAFFLNDYCKVGLRIRDVSFLKLFSETAPESPILRQQFGGRTNPYLFAMFDLAYDMSKNQHFSRLNLTRNTLTHRMAVLHSEIVQTEPIEGVERSTVSEFPRTCIEVMHLVRSAVMYLILFVDWEESDTSVSGPVGQIPATPLDATLRWRPN